MCAKLDNTGLVADTTYAIFQDEAAAGRERYHLYRTAEGGYWMTAEIDLAWPALHHEYLEMRVAGNWEPKSLLVRLSGELERDAEYHAEDSLWRAVIQAQDATEERTVPWTSSSCVETTSAGFYAATLNRLQFAPGALSASVDLAAVSIRLPSLEPVQAQHRYAYLGQETQTTPAGDWLATHFVTRRTDHLWADAHGIVVAARRSIAGRLHDYKLLEYHWLGLAS